MPSAEVISIGTELLLGQVLDTNSQYFAVELAKLGIDSFFRTTVGDNKNRIKDALEHALRRSDIVITSGGLGPTADDLTTECIAEFFGVEQEMDEAVVERIRRFFALRNLHMPESNVKQGLRPVGAQQLPNPVGTAPGIVWDVQEELLKKHGISGKKLILTFPGVPSELKGMWNETAFPLLKGKYGSSILWSRELKHFGIGESALAEQYAHLLDLQNPTVAPYAGRGECRLRVTAKANSDAEAEALAQPIIDEILAGSQHRFYGFDGATLESAVGKLLVEHKMTVSTAESCTGGWVSTRLTDIAGSSRYVELNTVTYSDAAKQKVLGVSEQLLLEHGAVSAECAQAMAEGMRKFSGADIAVSITGVAGPGGGTDGKPVGLVYFGLATAKAYFPKKIQLPREYSRDEIRFRTGNEALNMVRLYLINPDLLR